MVSQELKTKLRDVPHQPGVYIMKDRLGSIIYVGKAIDLKRRVSSYFVPSGKNRANLKTRALMDSIHDFEFHIVRNDEESMILEGKLIKDYRPRYNVAFKDDKRFLHARVRLTDPIPRLSYVRSKKKTTPATSDRFRIPARSSRRSTGSTADSVSRLPRSNPGEKDYKHCNADIIRNCSAPCIYRISKEDYLEKSKMPA